MKNIGSLFLLLSFILSVYFLIADQAISDRLFYAILLGIIGLLLIVVQKRLGKMGS